MCREPAHRVGQTPWSASSLSLPSRPGTGRRCGAKARRGGRSSRVGFRPAVRQRGPGGGGKPHSSSCGNLLLRLSPKDSVPLGARRAPPAVGAGLRNLGNTCYANAALQCLTYTMPLARRLLSRRHAEACPRPASCVLCAMRAHVARARWRHGEVIQPATGLIAGFHAHKQEDAHEFLMFTVDAMHQACLREPARRGGRGGGDSTPIRRTFGGYWRSQVKCLRCHGVSDTLDPYLDITLDIQAVQSVTQALELLVKPEKLDGDNSYHCSVCLEKVPASKTLTLHTPSEVLILVLKRFSDFTGSKLAKEVQYPEHLDMRQYLSQQDAGPLEYELYAVLVHAGWTCHSGHYFCYIKAGNGQWFKMDDARVTACDVSSALSQDAYVLFYTQKRELQRDSGSVSAGEGQRCHGAERAGTREPETRSEVRRPEAEEPERGPSGAQVTWEQWRLLQEQSRPAPQFNLRRVERALPADAVVIHASKFSGGVTKNHPERETQLLGDAAGDMAPPGARHTVPCLGGRAKAAKRKKKGWRPLDVLGVDSRVLRFERRQCTARLPEIIGLMAGSGDLPGGCVGTVSG
ncbi:ubiquitin carboxyl-terminal hydrolase 17-like protein 6 [Rousettus aegyptiacus]|uniref:ubiquitin carboxyl-terminal hydrolase 17-like protein 6 n=1 Tax=Rousettus aegyptiacus TaxID=9407 RepID=UPI00168D072D|nr:ubiquitin carboxyl-terminal hydrolase 17-like protein 6 [Rousettus aegyptiacus]